MKVKDALFEMKHGHRIAHRGIVTPDGRVTYRLNSKTGKVDVECLKGMRTDRWSITQKYFVENHGKCDFEIYD